MRERIVYLVTSGEYSSYGVDAAFSSLKRAFVYVDKRANRHIELYRLNDGQREFSIRRPWQIRMDKEGNVDQTWEGEPTQKQEERRPPRLWRGLVNFYVMARTEKQAIKAANEQRAQLIALNHWPTEDEY